MSHKARSLEDLQEIRIQKWVKTSGSRQPVKEQWCDSVIF